MMEIVIVLLIIFLWVYYYTTCPDIEWYKNVKEEYKSIKNRFGLPRFFSNEGKVVLWEGLGEDVPFSRIMLENRREYPLTLTIKYFIGSFKLPDILEISDTLIYDTLKKELTVRSNTISEGMRVLVVVSKFNKDLLTTRQVHGLLIQNSSLTKKINEDNYITLQNLKDEYYRSDN